MTGVEIIAEAREWLAPRTPWVHQQSCKGAGTDCIGFVAGVATRCGSAEASAFLADPANRNYGREPDPERMFAQCDALMDRVDPDQTRAGDVVILSCGDWPHHVGILALSPKGWDTLLHASLPHRRVVEHRLDDSWRSRIVRVYRIRVVA